MNKEDTPSGGGLLSKMVRFVRNPTVNWTELDSIQEDKESQYSKQMLKEMIERKRRNDFVRRREFDQLRKLRQRDALTGQRTEDPAARPSFFQSSLTSPDDRAVTIKKIDEIEAQMSMQWWKSKQNGEGTVQGEPPPAGGAADHAQASARAYAPTAPISLHVPLSPQPAAEPLFADDSMPIEGFGATASQALTGGRAVPPAPARAPSPQAAPAPVLEEFVHEPDLEEAAIRFANGDHAGAEAGLTDVLARHAQDDPDQQFEIWMTLFDLYRASTSVSEWWRLRMAALRFMGKPDEFEMVALDYCVTYEVSPPSWAQPRCGYSDDSGHAELAPAPAPVQDLVARPHWKDSTTPAPLEPSAPASSAAAGLSGHIEGDASPMLSALEGSAPAGQPLIIPCDLLIRIDFSAAGSVLNWAAEQQAQGRVVQFQNLHRLVAVFFNVVGINEHAWVVPRKN